MDVLDKILKDREQRFALRQAMVERGLSSISLNFNIPGYPKSSSKIQNAFELVRADLLRYLVACRISTVENTQELLHSESGDFFLIAVRYQFEDSKVKKMLEDFETNHTLGRLLDVDLMSAKGELVSSGKSKKCFLCDEPAKECMKVKRHTSEVYHVYVSEKIGSYLSERRKRAVITSIAQAALKATLYEVALEGKPGLVCPSSNGAHTDMDYFTFLSSSTALSYYWQEVATYGYEVGEKQEDIDYKNIRTKLRTMGVAAEQEMFQATYGINTQKGIVFLVGLGCFAAAYVFSQAECFSEEAFRSCVKELMQDIVKEDFEKNLSKELTHGKQAYKTYGKKLAGGARQEAETGFPTVFEYGLNYLKIQIGVSDQHFKKEGWQKALMNLLMLIISKSNDSNILYRKDANVLQQVQCQADCILSISKEKEKDIEIRKFANYCLLHNISPGGAADLLALTLFVYFIENFEFSAYSEA